jgi:hypothetical protein
MVVVSLFDQTTNMVKPWAEAGYRCYCIDLQHRLGMNRRGNIVRVGADALTLSPTAFPLPDILFAFPPCTDVAVSGARWMRDKGLAAIIDSLRLFKVATDFAAYLQCPYMIENPVSTVSTYWRAPDYKFNPSDYGDPYTKETWLWTGNGFVMPPIIQAGDMFDKPTIAQGPIDTKRIHHAAPGPDRANFRSETPMGFARAVFHANHRPKFIAQKEAPNVLNTTEAQRK